LKEIKDRKNMSYRRYNVRLQSVLLITGLAIISGATVVSSRFGIPENVLKWIGALLILQFWLKKPELKQKPKDASEPDTHH
jgi:hypothetical protein